MRGRMLAQTGSPSPPAVPGSAPPVLRGGFRGRGEDGGCADGAAGSAKLHLRELLMAQWVFDDSCKNLRSRVSFTAIKSLSSNLLQLS